MNNDIMRVLHSVFVGLCVFVVWRIVFAIFSGIKEYMWSRKAAREIAAPPQDRSDGSQKEDPSSTRPRSLKVSEIITIIVIIVLSILFILAFRASLKSGKSINRTTATPSRTARSYVTASPAPSAASTNAPTNASSGMTVAAYYIINYPMVWGYISKYADDPISYVSTYHKIWGNLHMHMGDGIPFDTLTSYEMSLVNYPAIGSFVYLAGSNPTTYHSTPKCFTLLRSDRVTYTGSYNRYRYEPCSKCVGK